MPQQLSGYEEKDSSKGSSLREVTVTSSGNKGYLDVIDKNSVKTNLEGVGDLTVGTSEVEIAITGTTVTIRIRADIGNTGIIFIGKTGVLSDGSNDFVRLNAGDEVIIDYDDSSNALYAISDTAAQTINVGALL